MIILICIWDQLQELRKVTMASMLCENMDAVYMVQPDVFISSDPYLNSPVTCDVFPRLVSIRMWELSGMHKLPMQGITKIR